MEVVVTARVIRHAKLQTNHHHQQINTQLSTGRMSFLLPNQQCHSTELKGKLSLVACYEIWPGNGSCLFLDVWIPHRALMTMKIYFFVTLLTKDYDFP